jgi:hypothetical protein
MAAYGILIQDNGDGSFSVLACNRGTTTTTFSGGTDLLTNNVTVSGGVVTAASGFLDTSNLVTTTLQDNGRKASLLGCIFKAGEICNNDRSFNS